MSYYSSESSESSQEQSSEASEDSFVSVSEDFLPTKMSSRLSRSKKRLNIGGKCMAQEEEEDKILWSRFSGQEDVQNWFVILFVIFVSLVDRKRFSGPLTSGKIAYSFTQSTLP